MSRKLVLTISCLLSIHQAAFAVELIAHWSFNKDGTPSAGNQKANLANGASIENGALKPNGYFVATDEFNDEFNLGSREFTIETWVKFDDLQGEQAILNCGYDQKTWKTVTYKGKKIPVSRKSYFDGWIIVKLKDNRLRFDAESSVGCTADEYLCGPQDCKSIYQVHPGLRPSVGKWHHIAVVRRNSKCSAGGMDTQLYLDGTLMAVRVAEDDAISVPTTTLRFGAKVDGKVPLKGAMDEVKVYRGAKSPAEISSTFQAGRQ